MIIIVIIIGVVLLSLLLATPRLFPRSNKLYWTAIYLSGLDIAGDLTVAYIHGGLPPQSTRSAHSVRFSHTFSNTPGPRSLCGGLEKVLGTGTDHGQRLILDTHLRW